MKKYLLHPFFDEKKKIIITKGEGIYLYSNNKKYTDLTGGQTGHSILGYNNKSINRAIIKQLNKISHIDYKYFSDQNRELLAKTILKNSKLGLDKFFLVGASGSEACEAACKASYQYFFDSGYKKKRFFISRKQSYHGATILSASLGDRPNLNFYKNINNKNCFKISEPNQFKYSYKFKNAKEYLEYCVKELEEKILLLGPENVCAYVAETMSGGLVGDVPPMRDYWKRIRLICNKYNVHLILDEVWCGTGVTGKTFCIEEDDVTPDFLFVGKTLAAGYGALSGFFTKNSIVNKIKSGSQGQIQYSNTHQGFSLSVAAALEVQKKINNKIFLNNVIRKGIFIRKIVSQELSGNDFFSNVRGRGMRNSIEYSCENKHNFGMTLKKILLEKYNIFIDAKWHRICLCCSINISNRELEMNLEILLKEFIKLTKIWKIKKNKKINYKSF